MSLTVGAALITTAISANAAAADQLVLARPVIEAGLKKAHCSIPPTDAKVVGTEWLGRRLRIVEVSCRRAPGSTGSILFAVPVNRPSRGRLITVQNWRDGHVVSGYGVASPTYDRKTRTLSSRHKKRRAGDCGTIKEWKWTGWSFRLIHVWNKRVCDGERFEWDNRHKWLVFPHRQAPHQPAAAAFAGPSLAK
jgi:Protein of unknown function (DUF1176)